MASEKTTKGKKVKVEILKPLQGRAEKVGAQIELSEEEAELNIKFKRVKTVGTQKVETR